MKGYSAPIHLRIDDDFERRPGDKVEVYGNGVPVLERDGNIAAVVGEVGWEKPKMICHIRGICCQ